MLHYAILTGLAAAAAFAQQYSPIDAITPQNVSTLRIAWTYRTGEPTTFAGNDEVSFEATPVYSDGLLYISTPLGRAIALDAITGEEVWRFDAEIAEDADYPDLANRGVSLWVNPDAATNAPCRHTIFYGTVDARLFALDAATGHPCAAFAKSGSIKLSEGVRQGPIYTGELGQTSPPALIHGLVVVGGNVADNVRADAPSGEVRAFNAVTGELVWTFDPLADQPGTGGANAWSRITVDEENGLLFVPFGSPSPDYYGGQRPGENRYANSVVALKADTGEVAWSFQTVHHDLWDYDVAAPPALTRVGDRAAVAVGSKSGYVYILDRLTGDPLFPVEEREVPKSDVPGEVASPTQPFPSRPPALSRQSLPDVWGPTEEAKAWCEEQIQGFRNEGVFTPPSLVGSISMPGNIGGVQWGGLASDPERNLLFVPTNNLMALMRLIPREDVAEFRRTHDGWETSPQRGTPYAMSRIFLLSPAGTPCNPPPFGTLAAIDATRGEIVWQVPLGMFPGADPGWGSINLGGALATKGGLVFIGASVDPAVRAFDAATGQELWKGELPASARSTPAAYIGPEGKPYIVISAGGHIPDLAPLDNAVVAFTLDQ